MLKRTSKSLAGRVDIGFHRRTLRARRLRWILGLVAAMVPLALLAIAYANGNLQIYQAGPLTNSHRLLENNCQSCHTESWQPLNRLVGFEPKTPSTPDSACIACHAGPPHHEDKLAAVHHCADCHREHRGHEALARVSDRFCIECHADLKTAAGRSENFAHSIDNFAAHPEFALLRNPESDPRPGKDHHLHVVAEPGDGKWRDRAPIAFNHHAHLKPDGIPRKPGDQSAQFVKLSCESCHQLNDDRRTMRPIKFVQHCQECHGAQLHFDFEGSNSSMIDTSVPHREPAIVQAVIRDKLTQFIIAELEKDPKFLGENQPRDRNRAPETDRLLPGQSKPEQLSPEAWEWVGRQLQVAEGLLFKPKRADSNYRGTGCGYCHIVEPADGLPKIVQPKIPDRWLSHSDFSHDSHRPLKCTECHIAAPNSTSTGDIMLPSVKSCRECHGAAATSASPARADCVECHRYHHRDGERFDGRFTIDDLLKGHAENRNIVSPKGDR